MRRILIVADQLLGGTELRERLALKKSTDPEIVAAYVLGTWRQPASEVVDLVRSAADEVERLVLPWA